MSTDPEPQRPAPPRTALSAFQDDGGLEWREEIRGARPGDRAIRIARHRGFRTLGPGLIAPRRGVGEPRGPLGRALGGLKRLLIGSPIATAQEITERVSVPRGLAIFASDNISSSAYATEEIMRVVVLAGTGALVLTMPITLAIVAVLAIVVVSYRQVIRAYPAGGGSYTVAHENLGPLAGLVAAAALLTDYVLTVAVSVSAGVAALTSAFPALFARRVEIALMVLALMTLVNLRGLRESGRVFTAPTYVYVISMLGLLALGIVRVASGSLPAYEPPPEWVAAHAAEPLALLLVLRAFASGSVALTGTEAVSNGVPAFKPPEVPRAQTTLVAMGALFATIFLGISFLAGQLGLVPDPWEEVTINSLLARALVGESWYYYLVQFSTALLLVLAANTAFNGFPRLGSILARDHYLPRQFSFRGDRLAFSSGIAALALVAGLLIWAYQGSVTGLIPLYTVGVFIAFTLSQAGLVRRWWVERPRNWRVSLVTNGCGAGATGIVAVVVGVSKFALGAWMVLLLIPILVGMMWSIRLHYRRMAQASQPETPVNPRALHVRAVVPVANVELPARQALAYALAIAPPERVAAVHVTDDEESAHRFRRMWQETAMEAHLVIIESPFRSLTGPLLAYIDAVRETHPSDTLTVVLPEYVPGHWWEHLLHNHTALRLKAALLFRQGVVVTNIPYHARG
ncbi:MAG: APC family permease [Chloroflexi bacterium]|nr:APC family permease [Chloroflexota bacterium]